MNFVVSLCWVKRGLAKTPTRIQLDNDELKKILESDKKNKKKKLKKESPKASNEDNEREEQEKLSDVDNEDDLLDIKADTIDTLAMFASNKEDDYLIRKDNGDESDDEDFHIKTTDNLIICGQIDKEVCTLNSYVYNDIEHSFYIHHDTILPSIPLCIECLDYDSTLGSEKSVNYVAIGSLNPWIEIWDLDILESLEPEFILGSRKKKKKNIDKKVKIKGHKDAVIDLSWNKINRNVLASCSADKSIILWDLDKLDQALKIGKNPDKFQSIEFHPLEAYSLLGGSFDGTVRLYDCRNPKENFKTWSYESGEIERVLWNHFSPNYFITSTSEGLIYLNDIRVDQPLTSLQAHDSSICGLSFSAKVPNLLVTGSEDEIVKIWDLSDNQFEFVDQKKFNIGSISMCKASPDSDFVFAFAGRESCEPKVWDLRGSRRVRDCFYPRMNITFTKEELDDTQEEKNDENEQEVEDEDTENESSKKEKKKKRKLNKDKNISKKKKKKILNKE